MSRFVNAMRTIPAPARTFCALPACRCKVPEGSTDIVRFNGGIYHMLCFFLRKDQRAVSDVRSVAKRTGERLR